MVYMWSFAVVGTSLIYAQEPTQPTRKPPVAAEMDLSLFSTEVAQAITELSNGLDGDLLITDCNGLGEYETIQGAIDAACDGDTVLVLPCTYYENIDFLGKAITVRSINPEYPATVEATVIDGSQPDIPGKASVVAFTHHEGTDSVLDGLFLTGGLGRYRSDGNLHGGGIYCEYSGPTVSNCIIKGNSVSGWGGGIYCRAFYTSYILRITGCTISNNEAMNSAGIYSACDLIILDSVIKDNVAEWSFGGIYCYTGDLTVANCVISGNIASGLCGGVASEHANAVVRDSMIINNTGCGVTLLQGHTTAIISNCTIAHNSAGVYAGGVNCEGYDTALFTNNIIWGNVAPEGPQILIADSTLTVDYSDIEGGQDGISFWHETGELVWGCDNIDLDPMFVDPDNGDFHITRDSFARNAGDPDFVPAEGEADIDGDPRADDGRVDLGADEFVLE